MAEFSTSIDIEAPPHVVFAHLVTAERMVAWMGQHAELQPMPGGLFVVEINGVQFSGQYLEVDPPHRVVVSWGIDGSDDFPTGSSRVEFTLTPTADGTMLGLHHSGLPDTAARTHPAGWAHYLGRLRLAAGGIDPGADAWTPATEPRPTRA
jgi:uncharacterized protein YndB with AHSA1/START domain